MTLTIPQILICLLVSSAPAAAATIYTWVDEKGITHYTDDPSQVPEKHEALDQFEPVQSMQAPDKALTKVQMQAAKERQRRQKTLRARQPANSAANAKCATYKRQLDKVQAQLRKGYREPRGNKLRQRRRELGARIKASCY